MTLNEIEALITALGTTRQGLAQLLGAPDGTMQDWCSGRRAPDALAVFAMRRLCASVVNRKVVKGPKVVF